MFFDVMRRIGLSLIFVVMLSAVAASTALAYAGSFSRPVRLRGETTADALVWAFAVNNQGQAVAAEGTAHGIAVYPVGSSGRLGKPWQVKLPGGLSGGETSVTLGPHGRIAVGAIYQHGVAIASWTLGETPPTAQLLALPSNVEAVGLHALQAPLLAIGPSAVTALWTIGREPEREHRSGPGEVQIEQAYGPFGSQLSSAQLFAAPKGVVAPHLSLEPNGDPVASWLDDVNKIRTVTGFHTGALQHSVAVQQPPDLSDVVGFTGDDEGDTVFSYFSRLSKNTSELRYMTSHDGSPFTPPRGIGLTGVEVPVATVLAGGHRTLLAFWGCMSPWEKACEEQGKIGTVSGAFSGSFALYAAPEAFISSSGRAVIIYDTGCCGLYAVTAEPGKPFTSPRRFATRIPAYFQPGAEHDEEPPLPTSPNGNALLYFTNNEHEQYLVRYTP